MESPAAEYFGSETQQALQRRAENVWTLVDHDPRFCCHGRAVGLADYATGNLPVQLALARLQGVCSMEGLGKAEAKTRKAELVSEGLVTDEFACWTGETATLDAARSILRDRSLADDLTAHETGPQTTSEDFEALDALTRQCEVLLPMGSFLRGHRKPSVFLYARDNDGRVVGASGAVAQFHPDHPKGRRFWWGMLATDASRRGEGIALLLGAMALHRMYEKYGFTDCFTGIREGNKPSEALCSKLALTANAATILLAICPEVFGGARVTK